MQDRISTVYILTNKYRTVLYVGVTSDLMRRMEQHRQKLLPGFTSKYNVDQLVYVEHFGDIEHAILREKQIKGWSRWKKDVLIMMENPDWTDLYLELCGDSSASASE